MLTIVACIAVVVALFVIQRLRAALGQTHARNLALQQEVGTFRVVVEELGGTVSTLNDDLRFFTRFVRELSHLTPELRSGASPRRVPSILLDVVTRSFEPRQALVLLRRTAAESEPGRHERLVVAAVAGDDSPWTPGLEIQLGEGELGLVAEAQRAMSRHDLDQHPVAPEAGGLAAFKPELAAPMVFDGSTVGLIGLAGIRRAPADSKAALHLLAQLGAVAIHNLAAFSRVQQSAHLDGLTQVFNKKHTTQLLSELLYECQKKPAPLSIFLFDIDHFKAYNDTNGHVAGDQLLRLVARLVRDNVRAGDVFGRFGGEEFLLVLPGTDLGPARRVAEKVRRAIADHPFPSAERQPLGCVSVSGGIAVCPTHALDSRGLLLAADQALYAAKHGGRNQVAVAESKYLSSDDEQFAGAAADSVQR